jgi:hypothetical protein
MKKIIVALCLISISVMAWSATSDDHTRRFGIFVGSNNGGRDRVMLRYAVSDARSVSRVFAEMGGVKGADNVLLIEPDIRELGRIIDRVESQIHNAKQTTKRTELVFYYSGHSDESGLLMGRERYSYQELRERINRIPSDMRIVILDSCASGAFTRTKGGVKTQPFLMDTAISAEGHAFLTSSSATESSQESDMIESSYFTHSLVVGLRGAADSVGDGLVTLNEAYRFAYTETLARTETTMHGAQHPSYDMQISGSGDVVLTDVKETSASVLIDAAVSGRLSIRDNSGYLIAEITKTPGRPIELGLERGPYHITLQQGDAFFRAEFILVPDTQTRLTMRDFTPITASPSTPRGTDASEQVAPSDDEMVEHDTINIQFIPRNSADLPQTMNNVLIGMVVASGYNLKGFGLAPIGIRNTGSVYGLEYAGLYDIIDNDMYGVQWTGLFNSVGNNRYGMQWAGLFNIIGNSVYGIQFAGLFNIVKNDFYGTQWAGLFNIAGNNGYGIQFGGLFNIIGNNGYGAQVGGLFNIAGNNFYGIQIALINVNSGGESHNFTVQLGLVNISENERDIPIGLVNIVKNGILNPAVYYDSYNMFNISFRSGSKYFYSLFSVGSPRISLGDVSFGDDGARDILVARTGIGLELPLKKFFIDVDVTSGYIFELDDSERRTHTVQGRILFGFKLFKHLGAFIGVSYDYYSPENDGSPVPTAVWDILPTSWSDEEHIHKLGFFAGIQF